MPISTLKRLVVHQVLKSQGSLEVELDLSESLNTIDEGTIRFVDSINSFYGTTHYRHCQFANRADKEFKNKISEYIGGSTDLLFMDFTKKVFSI